MTTPIERDASGRFVKPDSDEPVIRPEDDQIHPLSRLLFGWVDSPRTPIILLLIVVLIAGILIVADLALERHEYLSFANSTGFYAFWGFSAFAIAVLSGWPLGKLLRRDEDYYGEAETTPDDVETRK